jgi:hypothetical protein
MSSYDPLDVASQVKSKADKTAKELIERNNDDADFKWLMGNKRGRRIIWRQLDRAGVFRLSFNTNAMQMAFTEGNRNEGLRTLAKIHTLCPELYTTLVKENVNDRNNADD